MPNQQSPNLTEYDGAPLDLVKLAEALGKLNEPTGIDPAMGFTMHEIAAALGLSRNYVTHLVKQAIGMGRMELSGKRPMVAIDGGVRLIPVYRLIKP